MGRLTVAWLIAMTATTQTSTSWRSAPTPELMLPSSTDCWEPAIAVGPRNQVYIVAGRRAVYGHYGGAAISSSGRLFAVWAEGEPDYRTGSVWFNGFPLAAN